MIQVRLVEDNIVTRISTTVPEFSGNVLSAGDMDAIMSAVKKDAACFVVFESEEYGERDLTGNQTGKVVWQALILARSMREQKGARQGAGGAYELSEKVESALRNFDPINNRLTTPDFPMELISRQQYPNPDTSEYYMLVRFSHPVDTFI